MLFVESSIKEFVENKSLHVERYLYKALLPLSESDGDYVKALIVHKLNKAVEAIETVACAARGKFDRFVETTQGHTPFPEEESEIESAVAKAGENCRTSVDKLFRR